MGKPKKVFLFSLALFILISILLSKSKTQNPQEVSPPQPKIQGVETVQKTQETSQNIQDQVLVERVIDGDTIEIAGGQKVRYIGIDTPETVHPEKPVQCFGTEASQKNKELVEGKLVLLEKDVSETDKYGRLLRYVYIQKDDPAQTIFVNDYLVRQGYAHSSSYPPDVKYQDQFQQAEANARDNNRGLWTNCLLGQDQQSNSTVQSPLTIGPNGCNIKGNISSSGEKIYHLPDQRYYQKTIINQTKGEKWFCSEDDAQKAGFRKSNI